MKEIPISVNVYRGALYVSTPFMQRKTTFKAKGDLILELLNRHTKLRAAWKDDSYHTTLVKTEVDKRLHTMIRGILDLDNVHPKFIGRLMSKLDDLGELEEILKPYIIAARIR